MHCCCDFTSRFETNEVWHVPKRDIGLKGGAVLFAFILIASALGSRSSAATFTVTNTLDSGIGSLRWALTNANALPDADTNTDSGMKSIDFNFSGSGPFTIHLTSPLPSVVSPLMLDATAVPGFAGQPLVELDGGGMAGDGLIILASNCTVRGLAIGNFAGAGIRLEQGASNSIVGNFIGVRADGTIAFPNQQHGVLVVNSIGNKIGGVKPGAGNVISGNLGDGIRLDGTATSGNVIQGNFIGTDASGHRPLGNGNSGIEVAGAWSNLVGGTNPGSANLIAFNGRNGIMVLSGDCAISGNSIFANTSIAIDLGGDGATANDFGDVDAGPNGFQNFPEILTVSSGLAGTTLLGRLLSAPSTPFHIEFFVGKNCGDAVVFLGSIETVSDVLGEAIFAANFAATDVSGLFIMATATDPSGNTSEFSACQRVALPPASLTQLTLTGQPQSQSASVGGNVSFSINYSGNGPIKFQWRRNGVNIDGATNGTLNLTNVQVADSGAYSVVLVSSGGALSSSPGILTVSAPALALQDDFAFLTTLTTSSGIGRGSNTLASLQLDEPRHAGKPCGSSVWINWQAPHHGIATFSTSGSTFDTVLAVYTGTALTNLVEVTSDDDQGGFHTSVVSFNAIAGVEYHIAIAGFADGHGDIVLSWNLETTLEKVPVIVAQPLDAALAPGSDAVLSVATSGLALNYQWFFNDAPIASANGNTLLIPGVDQGNVGHYYVRVGNATRTVRSRSVALELAYSDSPPLTNAPPARSANKFLDVAERALRP